jgi:tyrosine-specific transport protein
MFKSGKNNFFSIIIPIALLITGNLIGAGILGLPVNTGIDGFFPSLLAMLVFGGGMLYSAIVLSGEAVETKDETFNYPSLYQKYLGSIGKWIAIAANMLILYGLLTAYLTGATTIVASLMGIKGSTVPVLLVVFVIFTVMTVQGLRIIEKYNIILVILMWASFGVIVLMGERHVEPVRLLHTDWAFLPVAVPIIVTSFHFHNIIPNVCSSLKWDMKKICVAILVGMIIGYVMNAVWIQVGVGALPLNDSDDSIIYAFQHNLPATVPMSHVIHSPVFITCSMLFALLAIITSYVTNGLGLRSFNSDLVENFFKKSSPALVLALTFGPPFLISYFFPDIFLKIIDLVGGVGIVMLFGVLPSIIAYIKGKTRGKKLLAIAVFFLFTGIFLFQLGEQFGLIKLTPKAAHVERNITEAQKKGR